VPHATQFPDLPVKAPAAQPAQSDQTAPK
jgi:hypothetical protein